MNRIWLLCLASLFLLAATPELRAEETAPKCYELRTYFTNPGKLEALKSRFRDHTVKLFEKHGMTNVAYWEPTANEEQILVYLMAYPTREAREASWKGFIEDPDWKAAYAESTKDGKLVRKVDSVFLEPTDYSPASKIESKEPVRLFELRRYTTNPGKLSKLDSRFRDHTIALFAKHGMTNLFYFHLAPDQEESDNTLVYLLAHRGHQERDESFEAFRLDPVWQAARDASEAEGPLLIKGGVQSLLLTPLDFSPMK